MLEVGVFTSSLAFFKVAPGHAKEAYRLGLSKAGGTTLTAREIFIDVNLTQNNKSEVRSFHFSYMVLQKWQERTRWREREIV
jgi:hypothetical protein